MIVGAKGKRSNPIVAKIFFKFNPSVLANILMNGDIEKQEDDTIWDAIVEWSDMREKATWKNLVPDLELKKMQIDIESLMLPIPI